MKVKKIPLIYCSSNFYKQYWKETWRGVSILFNSSELYYVKIMLRPIILLSWPLKEEICWNQPNGQ